jgi:hypothetical protein
MSQTTAPVFDSALGQAGQIADTVNRTVDSFAAEGVVPFGAAVERGTDPAKQVKAFDGGAFVGVAVFSHTEVTGQYEDEAAVGVMTKGRVVVDTLAVNVTAGETAYVVDASGVWTNVSSNATAAGKFLTSGAGLNVVDVNALVGPAGPTGPTGPAA